MRDEILLPLSHLSLVERRSPPAPSQCGELVALQSQGTGKQPGAEPDLNPKEALLPREAGADLAVLPLNHPSSSSS